MLSIMLNVNHCESMWLDKKMIFHSITVLISRKFIYFDKSGIIELF